MVAVPIYPSESATVPQADAAKMNGRRTMNRRIGVILWENIYYNKELRKVFILTIPSIILLISPLNLFFLNLLFNYFPVSKGIIQHIGEFLPFFYFMLLLIDAMFSLITFVLWIGFPEDNEKNIFIFLLIIQLIPLFIAICIIMLTLNSLPSGYIG